MKNLYNNIIFDLGNVLLTFRPRQYLKRYTKNQERLNKLYKNIFDGPEWIELDKGLIGNEQAAEKMIERQPTEKEIIVEIIDNWERVLTPIQETVNLLNELHNNGYNLYVLSNFHKQAYITVKSKYDFFELFTGAIISSIVHSIKPEPEIYRKLLDKYKLKPEHSIFIDDRKENVVAGRKFGLETIHCQNTRKLKSALKRTLNKRSTN